MSGFTYLVACTGNLLSFSAGTSYTWSSPELEKLQNDTTMNMTNETLSWISSIFLLGFIIGPFIYGFIGDTIGRKYTLVGLGVQLTFCYLLMAFVKHVAAFYIARTVIGISSGGIMTVLPMYLVEISITENRGRLTSLLNVFMTAGILFCYAVGPYTSILVFNLILSSIPGIFTVVFLLLAPESPLYLVKKQNYESAKQVLLKFRSNSVNVEEELIEMKEAAKDKTSKRFLDIFKTRGTVKAFYIALGLFCFMQLTGISAVLLYAQPIFKKAGTALEPAICSIILGAVMWLSSFIVPSLVERFGRKKLLLASVGGICLSELPLGVYMHLQSKGTNLDAISFFSILCMILIILFQNIGIGPLPFTILGELFPSDIKAPASAAVITANGILGFIVTKYFQSISDNIGIGVCFMIFSGLCALATLFVQFLVIETGGKTLEQIQEELNN